MRKAKFSKAQLIKDLTKEVSSKSDAKTLASMLESSGLIDRMKEPNNSVTVMTACRERFVDMIVQLDDIADTCDYPEMSEEISGIREYLIELSTQGWTDDE